MAKGLYIKRKDECIEKVIQNTANLSLLANGDGIEIMIQKIDPNNEFIVYPGSIDETMEFFYILEGEIEYEYNDTILLKNGDYFYTKDLKETALFRTVTKVSLLYASTQPFFHHMSKKIGEIREMALKSQEKDMYTHNHGDRVKHYAVKIADKLYLSRKKIQNIGYASLFHDIGKIRVPDKILKKPSCLTDDEMDIIKKHPAYGMEIVRQTYFFDKIASIIEQHHERLDGSGYPKGLKDEEILLEAKIIAVADCYDAMTTDRPYRKALTPEVAINELKKLMNIQYDERSVSALEDILKEEEQIK